MVWSYLEEGEVKREAGMGKGAVEEVQIQEAEAGAVEEVQIQGVVGSLGQHRQSLVCCLAPVCEQVR